MQLPDHFVIVFDPVTHGTQFLDVKGEPTRERQTLSMVFDKLKPPAGTIQLRPGPLRLSLENGPTAASFRRCGLPAIDSTICSASASLS